MPASSPSSGLPARIGRFEIVAKLGEGAFGIVYRARDPQHDREVALKVAKGGILESPKRLERFLREYKAAAGLRHPNIVPVYDTGREGDVLFIASAFIDGESLSDVIESGGLDLHRSARLVSRLAEAVAYAHTQGVVHRDIKPANILLDGKGKPFLTDFGLAARSGSEKLTNDGAILGTPAYMAPEQAGGQQGEAEPAADQYSLGVMLYELMTGHAPFAGPPAVVLFNQVHTEPPAPSSWRPRLPRDLETICLKAIAKRPQDRYENCQHFADDLRRWLHGAPVRAQRIVAAELSSRNDRGSPASPGDTNRASDMVQVRCPHCGRKIPLKDSELTLLIECAGCDGRFYPSAPSHEPLVLCPADPGQTFAARGAVETTAGSSHGADGEAPPSAPARPRLRRPRKKRKRSDWLAIILGVSLGLIVFFSISGGIVFLIGSELFSVRPPGSAPAPAVGQPAPFAAPAVDPVTPSQGSAPTTPAEQKPEHKPSTLPAPALPLEPSTLPPPSGKPIDLGAAKPQEAPKPQADPNLEPGPKRARRRLP